MACLDLQSQPFELLDQIVLYLPYQDLLNLATIGGLKKYTKRNRFQKILRMRKREYELREHLLRLSQDPGFTHIIWADRNTIITLHDVNEIIRGRLKVIIYWDDLPKDRDFWDRVNDIDIEHRFDQESGQYFIIKLYLDVHHFIHSDE